jgi:hypothetical protein
VDQLSSELSLGFVGVDAEIALTCGSEYLPLNLRVSEFTPKSDQVDRVPTISTQSVNGLPLFEYQSPLPIAFRGAHIDLLERCRNHIKLVVEREKNLPGLITQRGHKINRLALKAIARYRRSIRPSRSVSQILCYKI